MDPTSFPPMTARHAVGLPLSTQRMVDTQHTQTNATDVPPHENNRNTSSATATNGATIKNSLNIGPPFFPFHKLPDELLGHIVDFLVHDTVKLLPIEQRASLSSESFVSVPPYITEDSKGLIKFRNVCRKFWEVGRSRAFTRVNIRFSTKSFGDIEWLVRKPEIARDIRKISYMVQDFYPQDRELWDRLLHEARTASADCLRRRDEAKSSPNATAGAVRRLEAELERSKRNEDLIKEAKARAGDQRQILQGRVDENVLLVVLKACKNLQQIRLMRSSDDLDKAWQNFLNTRRDLRLRLGSSRWIGACQRATIVLGRSYLASESKAHRFSSRFMDPSSEWLVEAIRTSGSSFGPDVPTIDLPMETDVHTITPTFDSLSTTAFAHISPLAISDLAKSLTCLELQIGEPSLSVDAWVQEANAIGYPHRDPGAEALIKKMTDLSDAFYILFNAAVNMEGLHISLLRQVAIPIETIFQNITWPRLLYIGFSRWDLPSDEIINLIRRHKTSLRSVRLREVRLTSGKWIEVAQFLRQELKLKWVSFRQVGYKPRIGGGLAPDPGFRVGFAALMRGPPEDEFEESISEKSDESNIGDHAGTGNPVAQQSEGEDTDPSENGETEALASSYNESLETTEAIDLGIHRTTQSEDYEAGPSNSNEFAGSIAGDEGMDSQGESLVGSVAGDSEVEVVNDLALDDRMMVQHSSASDDPLPGCNCGNGYAWEDLEDDYGLDPTKPQWKKWERWVVRGCSIKGHDPRAP